MIFTPFLKNVVGLLRRGGRAGVDGDKHVGPVLRVGVAEPRAVRPGARGAVQEALVVGGKWGAKK